MTTQSYTPSILSFTKVHEYAPVQSQRFRLADYYQTILVCSSFVLAYFYKLWPFWFVFAFFTLKSLHWAATVAEKKRVEMTSSPYTFYLSWFNAIQREFWMALSSVFHSINRMLAGANYMPPPPMLSRSNTEVYNEYMYSTSLGRIHVSTYNMIRTCYYIAVMFCIVAPLLFILYCMW
jgi:hypothetical protein